MVNPLDAPDAVSAVAEQLEELLDESVFVSFIHLFHVVPVAGTARGHDSVKGLAQAVFDAGPSGHRVGSVALFESPRAWRDVFRRQVTEGIMSPAARHSGPGPASPADIRRAGELADGVADLIGAHLGPVLSSGDVDGPHTGYIWWRNLLLVTGDWATVLHFGICD
ncbi:hypothetical protein GCM10023235_71760 [Kitasatospora terrestris]|uniref:Uncharacterized protein n=1 Tax=Kitasatospora terrestris TaxID=258051 RepID=A0ABP9EKB7_9ACTN